MKYFLVISILLCCVTCLSQKESGKEEPGIFYCRRIEKDAQVDINHWKDYLAENLELDSLAQDTIPAGIYRLTAQILIGKSGCIEQVKIIDDPGYGLGIRVVKVISSYQQWVPAEMNGRRVKAYRKQPIIFMVEK
jgi:hypothetical protein